MSFASPLWLAVAGVVAAGLILAHLISTSVPQRDPLPTARFVPEGAPLTVLRTRRLTDIALLLVRLLAVALLGLALAGARVPKGGPERVVLADMSRAVASPGEVRDSVAALGSSAVMVSFDTASRLSAGLVAAHRILSDVTKNREKTELVIVSPLVREEVDSATASLLELWPGPVRHVRVAAATAPQAHWSIRASADDPVAASLASSREPRPEGQGQGSRVVRDQPTSADSAWARDSAGALVIWPADLSTSSLQRRTRSDSAQGIAAGAHVVIGVFSRSHDPRDGSALAHWLDGVPAATEAALGTGCVREVAIPVDRVGDIALRDNFRAIARALVSPCDGERDFAPVELSTLLGPRARSDAESVTAGASSPIDKSRMTVWLAAIAFGALLLEQMLRRRRTIA